MSSSASITLGDLAQQIGAELRGDSEKVVKGLNSIEKANIDEVSFITRDKFLPYLSKTQASAIILSKKNLKFYDGMHLLVLIPIYYLQKHLRFLWN